MIERKKAHAKELSLHGDTPFLAMFAEDRDCWTPVGNYDESADVWVVRGQPLATACSVTLDTMTFTRSGGESNDRD